MRSLTNEESPCKPMVTNMYILTIKCNLNQYINRISYIHQLQQICDKGIQYGIELSSHYTFELDSKNRLHYHVLCTFQKTPQFTKFMKSGWHIHFQPINSWERGIAYIHKDCEGCMSQSHTAQWDQREDISYFKYNYGFI